MSAQEGHPPNPSANHRDAGARRLERVLRTYGPLTRARLYELSGARSWTEPGRFDGILTDAVRSGELRMLGGVLIQAVDD